MGFRLFDRGARGYTLTSEGRALLQDAEMLRDVSRKIHAFTKADVTPKVRITAGTWTARFLAKHIHRVWTTDDDWMPEFLPSNAPLDIARREADIGIRNRRPDQSWLAGRRTSEITFAIYGKPGASGGFVALPNGPDATPSVRWVHETHGERIVTTASDPRLAMDLVCAGIGAMVLPTFAGDSTDDITRLSEVIPELSHEEWLVAHHDGRHDPPVRAALTALTALLTDASLRPKP